MSMPNDQSLPAVTAEAVAIELATIVLGEDSLTATLQRVADLTRRLIPELLDVSITLIENDRPRTVVFTGQLASDLDERKYEHGHGPCLDAAQAGVTIVLDSAGDASGGDLRYPDFAHAAAGRGVTSTLAVGLSIPHRVTGALNMYSGASRPIAATSVAAAQTFAGYAAVAVANATLLHSTADLVAQMEAAMQSRAVIEQAKGILMAQRHCTAEAAFALLIRGSQRRNQKLRDLAVDIVNSTTQPGPRPGPTDRSNRNRMP